VTRSAGFALAAVAAGVLAAMLLPGAPVGVGYVVVAVALALAVAVSIPSRGRGGTPKWDRSAGGSADGASDSAGAIADRVARALLAVLALALAASAAFRDADWVVGWELVAAVVLGSIAVVAPRHWRAIGIAMLAGLRLISGARSVGGAVAHAVPRGATPGAFALGRGLLLAGALVAIFGALFAAGDRAFAQLAGGVLPDELPLDDAPLRLLVFAFVVSLAGALARAAAIADVPLQRPLLRLGRVEWRIALIALNVLFALFVAVQLAVLFGGDGYVRDTAGLTYADYARSGFTQLVVVAVLTLAVVAAALRWSRTEDARQARLLRVLLATLCLLTLVVLASALHRLGLYEQAFGYTRTRLAVHGLLLFGGALFALVIAALASGRRAWLARATVVLSALSALAFWVSDPDRRIAAHNVERYEATGRIDTDYLSELSADAVPVLVRLPADLRSRALAEQHWGLDRRDGVAGANLARARAREVLAALP
jgi:hypothetical protein